MTTADIMERRGSCLRSFWTKSHLNQLFKKRNKCFLYVVANLYQHSRWPQYGGKKSRTKILRLVNSYIIPLPLKLRTCWSNTLSSTTKYQFKKKDLSYTTSTATCHLDGTFKKTIKKFNLRKLLPLKYCSNGLVQARLTDAGLKPVLLQITLPKKPPKNPTPLWNARYAMRASQHFLTWSFRHLCPQDLGPYQPKV